MKINSLYISAKEFNAGSLFVSMGMMEILKQNLPRVAFFRPVIFSKNMQDNDILFMLEHYKLDMKYEDAYGVDVAYVESMLAANKEDALISELLEKFKKLEKEYDFVLCEGIRLSFLNSIHFDINLKLAQNFGASYINIILAKDKSAKEVYENILIDKKEIQTQGCSHFASFVNRASAEMQEALKSRLKDVKEAIFYLNEVEELSLCTVQDVMESLDAKPLFITEHDHTRTIRSIKIAALSLDNFLAKIEEDDLIVVPADRSEIILGLFASLYSKNYANISAIVFPFSMQAHPNIQKLIDGLSGFGIPILSVSGDTYETAKKLMNIHGHIRINSTRKIALAMGLFRESVNIDLIEQRIKSEQSDVMTPLMFQYKLFEMAASNLKRVVLPEAEDERILRAAEIILHRKVADIILLGDEEEVKANYLRLGLDLSNAVIINPHTSPLMEQFVESFYELRRSKGLSKSAAQDAMTHFNYFATMMVQLGYADAMVSGAIHPTADTIRPALQIIKTKPDYDIVSSIFFMCLDTKVLVYGDCAIVQDPDAKELAQIAIASARSAKMFGITPRVAMLSYSTGESGHGSDVDKVREATQIVKEKNADILVEGPIQYDAAIDAKVAKIKLPNSQVAGRATVFVFPDLNTGNNTYKAVQRSSGAIAIGPVLQGLKKPVNDLSRGCLVEDIVNTIAITAIQAGED
ncbi:phosphate acetyltransferase [Sulfurimonas sp.]|uniref:phosphate acetyltransferase n=1 Tax=Sulfurimonas sp. TaxID=2022749 RepID=UPI00260D3541|nr:phosphate acetyltransferase [Sulfurimonas sp.]